MTGQANADYGLRIADSESRTTNDAPSFLDNLNPNSLEVLADCKLEPSLAAAAPGARFQFERHGYFCSDPDSTPDKLIFNRTVTLRDTWAKQRKADLKLRIEGRARNG